MPTKPTAGVPVVGQEKSGAPQGALGPSRPRPRAAPLAAPGAGRSGTRVPAVPGPRRPPALHSVSEWNRETADPDAASPGTMTCALRPKLLFAIVNRDSMRRAGD